MLKLIASESLKIVGNAQKDIHKVINVQICASVFINSDIRTVFLRLIDFLMMMFSAINDALSATGYDKYMGRIQLSEQT